jgi:hypothetical protein
MFTLDKVKARLDDLLLDPNNPRFFELHNWTRIEPELYSSDRVQKLALDRFEKTNIGQIDELVDSIKSNGYIPAEMIVVKPYEADQSKYVVIEGNRRLTAIKRIVQEALDPENDSLVQSLKEMEVLVYRSTGDIEQDQINVTILQGIRHISGPKEWGAYQKANLIVQLHDDASQTWSEIGKRLGLSSRVVIRYYRAYKALRQMKQHEEFGQKARPDLFSLFDEALKSNAIREWLRWQDNPTGFTDYQRLYMFYCLLVDDLDSGRMASITNPQHMRQFSEILMSGKSDVLAKFLEGEISIETAARLAKPEPLAITLHDSLQSFIDMLAKFPAEQLSNISPEDLELFNQITQKIENIRKLHSAFLQVEKSG